MCGRFTLTTLDLEEVARALDVPWVDPELARSWRPHHNVAPTSTFPVVRLEDGARRMELLRWGLRGFSRGDGRAAAPLSLARTETVATSKAFGGAFRARRCVVPMDGFFEWGGAPGVREPHWISTGQAGPELLLVAGLWEGPSQGDAGRFALLTAPAKGAAANVHNRMPALLSAEAVAGYLTAEAGPKELLTQAETEASRLRSRRVSRRVNSTRHDDPGCLEEAGPWADLPLFRSL